MKFKALVTALVLGSSSIALAAPTVIKGPNVRDHRVVDTYQRPANGWGAGMRATWVALSQPLQLERGRQVIRVDGAQRFDQLRIERKSGVSRISHVTVVYRDGTRQQVKLGKQIGPASTQLQFAVPSARPIASLIIHGTSGRRGTYQVFGHSTRLAR